MGSGERRVRPEAQIRTDPLPLAGGPRASARRLIRLIHPDCHRGGIMDFPAQFATLEQRTSDARSTVRAAATETREQLQSRLDQAQVDMDVAKSEAHQKAEEAKDKAQSKWAQIKADRRAKMDELKAKIEKRNRQQDAKVAEEEAEWA